MNRFLLLVSLCVAAPAALAQGVMVFDDSSTSSGTGGGQTTLVNPYAMDGSTVAGLAKTIQDARNGSQSARVQLGRAYYYGIGADRDVGKAGYWLRLADQGGDAEAPYLLGVMTEKGEGILQSYAEALRLFERAAERGNAEGQYKTGVYYRDGVGGTRIDTLRAFAWLNRSANQAHVPSMLALADMYDEGKLGVPLDHARAAQLRAAAGGGR